MLVGLPTDKPKSRAPRDEWSHSHPQVSPHYLRIEEKLQSLGPAGVARLAGSAQDFMREQGITLAQTTSATDDEAILPFDLLPLILSESEWTTIEHGLSQRVRAWNAFLKDIYHDQDILRANLVPFELVYSDPNFLRPCMGLSVAQDVYVHVSAADLVRGPKGEWLVLEDHMSDAMGSSYALQGRRILSQLCGDWFEGAPIQPIYDFPTQLLETLQAIAPGGPSTPRVVLLSPGFSHEASYDHAQLARQMGVPLVQGGDLLVLDGELYLKTIGGLERVDVVYRRLDGADIDPVTLRSDSRLGVPGLISCVRKGTVTVANALGSGVADNRALLAYMPRMIEFYLGEKPKLGSIKTRTLNDVDVREEVFDHMDRYVFKETFRRGVSSVHLGSSLSEQECNALRRRILDQPTAFVTQSHAEMSTCPTWLNQQWQPRAVGLRVFSLCNANRVHVSPCALTRVALRTDSLQISSGTGGGVKDTWILRTETDEEQIPEYFPRQTPGRMRLGSRTADSLYWMGRYAERAEATTRILRVVQQIRLEDSLNQSPKAWNPLWETLASATGHPTSFFKKASFHKSTGLAEYILLDPENYGSALSCLRVCRHNAQQIREALPPEVWTVLNKNYLRLVEAAAGKGTPEFATQLESFTLHDSILTDLDELSGASSKHMLHNDAWYFLELGRHLERALFTVFTMRQVFLKRQDERSTVNNNMPRDDRNLDALLRMLAGQYAYRSSFKSRPGASQVSRLLLQDEEFPRSVAFGVSEVHHCLGRIFGERGYPDKETPIKHTQYLLSELQCIDLSPFFSTSNPTALPLVSGGSSANNKNRSKAFADWLESLGNRLLGLSTMIADHYLNHQAAAPQVRM
jgi:uncharacterized circularly permuted ATP-grasp superfamily protein/uncharacterized alpha-E superfamily protein